MLASGADALDHSTSRAASSSSLVGAGIFAVRVDLREVAGLETIERKIFAEGGPVFGIGEIGVFDERDGDAFAGEALLPEREDVVDGGEVVGGDDVEGVVLNGDLEARAATFFRCDRRRWVWVGCGAGAGRNRGERRRRRSRELSAAGICGSRMLAM